MYQNIGDEAKLYYSILYKNIKYDVIFTNELEKNSTIVTGSVNNSCHFMH